MLADELDNMYLEDAKGAQEDVFGIKQYVLELVDEELLLMLKTWWT
jgi:hypothetical protein